MNTKEEYEVVNTVWYVCIKNIQGYKRSKRMLLFENIFDANDYYEKVVEEYRSTHEASIVIKEVEKKNMYGGIYRRKINFQKDKHDRKKGNILFVMFKMDVLRRKLDNVIDDIEFESL